MICPHCNSDLPEGLQVCFRCGKPLQKLPSQGQLPLDMPLKIKRTVSVKLFGGIAAALALVLGAAVGGHFMGLYELPLFPAIEENTASERDNPKSVQKSNSNEDDAGDVNPEIGEDMGAESDNPQALSERGGTGEDNLEIAEETTSEAEKAPQNTRPTSNMKLCVSVPNLEIQVDQNNPLHAVIELSGYPTPEWIFEPQDSEESGVGIAWSVFLSSDGENLYQISGEKWYGKNMERFNDTDYAISDMLAHYNPGYTSSRGTGLSGGVANVSSDSLVWDFTIAGNEPFDMNIDLNSLTYVGYEIEEYNVDVVSQSYALQNGEWADLGEINMREYFIEINP